MEDAEKIAKVRKMNTLASLILKFHRELAIGKATGIREDDDEANTLSSSSVEHYDIFNHEASNSKRSVECKCFVCHRLIAAARFVPHLEKCIGIGRNSRITRRKAANYSESVKPTGGTRARSSSSNILNENDELNDDNDDEWSNSSTSRKRPKTRASRRAKQP